MDLNSQKALLKHRNTIKRKKILNKIYLDFYNKLLDSDFPKGSIVEIGSGGGFIKEISPEVITSDVISGPGIDRVFPGDKMPYKNNSMSGFVMIDVLHHIKDPEKALKEMERCLKKGGKIIMIEPYISLWGTFIYKYFHSEKKGFNAKSGWEIEGTGRMSDANPALAWIIFKRDREKFEKKFPSLKIIKLSPHTPLRYLISGGLSKFQLLPKEFYLLIVFIEERLAIFNEKIGMFITIELQKL